MKKIVMLLIISVAVGLLLSGCRRGEESGKGIPELGERKATGLCSMCSKPLAGHEKTLFFSEYQDGKKYTACCAHCGVVFEKKMRVKGLGKLKSAWTYDFINGEKIDGLQAWYVKDSKVIPCCLPTIIAFATREDAETFQRTNGGKVYSFEEVVNLSFEELMIQKKLKMMREKGVL